MRNSSEVDVAIVGAGAAGLAAAKTLTRLGKTFVVLEASHRTGGRGYTEEVMPGVPFDLGCHWLHSADLNPFVKIADELGIGYAKVGYPRDRFSNGKWRTAKERGDWEAFYVRQEQSQQQVAAGGSDCSIYEATEREHAETPWFDYVSSISSSFDVDQISVIDQMAYNDTEVNWPVKDGYGTLISRYGSDVPVSLNCAVREIDWSGSGVKLATAKGTVSARRTLVTVSTGILSAGDIRFTPDLPHWKQEAISALPLGCHNRICLAFDRDVFGTDARHGFLTDAIDDVPMSFYIRPFGFNTIVALTGGRFADWLEKAGQQAGRDYVEKKLQAVFGSNITRHVCAQIVTAWRGDPWVKGAYSAALPGQAHQRARLAAPVGDMLYFAGEATSAESFSTAHGAYFSGINAAEAIAN